MADDLAAAWRAVQARMPPGWTLDSLRCASTGLGVEQRSEDWIALAIGPAGQPFEKRAPDPQSALDGLVTGLANYIEGT